MKLLDFLVNEKWEIAHTENLPASEAKHVSYDDLSISDKTKEYLSLKFKAGLYEHQKLALQRVLSSKNVCLTTGTASGKSLPFYLAGIELLSKQPTSTILAIYPMKALAREQEERWANAVKDAELDVAVGRIDGQVPISTRAEIVRRCRVLVATPDVMHAWMFTQLNSKAIRDFLRNLALAVVDEVHTYTGVFGSNSAFLFRRLRHILQLLECDPIFICASATIADSKSHLSKLFGLDFEIVDQSQDSSPKQAIQLDILRPPLNRDVFKEISTLLSFLSKEKSSRFIAFVDSRKQTELIASIVSREREEGILADPNFEEEANSKWNHLQQQDILPYRAGYEEQDRAVIQERLSKGTLAGIISTSALELGMDIPHLTVGILIGVPYSSTSLHQRIGRIGRHAPGNILVISRGSVYDETILANPSALLKRPLAESALYLENQRIQYIHALCIGRHGGEHDQILHAENRAALDEFKSKVIWPEGFLELCAKERIGEVASELQAIKNEAGDDPNHAFPLRDVEVQFKVLHRVSVGTHDLGQLSHSQLMREAYPGAVYYYTGQPYRVSKINVRGREIQVKKEKKYTTSPLQLPTMIFPNLSAENIFEAKSFGKLVCIECNLQVREAISGYSEQRGPTKLSILYPTDSKTVGVFFDQQRFSRNYFTTGIILTHPSFNKSKVELELLANLLFEAFLMIFPFERRDVSSSVDKHRMQREQFAIEKEAKFIAIYDQTYGSLRLTSHLLVGETLRLTIKKAIEICKIGEIIKTNQETTLALEALLTDANLNAENLSIHPEEERYSDKKLVKVLLPQSKGLYTRNGNKEFQVEGVFFDSKLQRVAYRGRYVEDQNKDETKKVILPVEDLVEVPGDSGWGYYSLETGELITS